jgi:hypothetical protein
MTALGFSIGVAITLLVIGVGVTMQFACIVSDCRQQSRECRNQPERGHAARTAEGESARTGLAAPFDSGAVRPA